MPDWSDWNGATSLLAIVAAVVVLVIVFVVVPILISRALARRAPKPAREPEVTVVSSHADEVAYSHEPTANDTVRLDELRTNPPTTAVPVFTAAIHDPRVPGAPGAPSPLRSRFFSDGAEAEASGSSRVDDDTVVVPRPAAATGWVLETTRGQRLPLTWRSVIVGRHPRLQPMHAAAELLAVDDPDKTVSGTHCLLELGDDGWTVTDLDSTNGVVLLINGFETAVKRRSRTAVSDEFFLGDLGVRIVREA